MINLYNTDCMEFMRSVPDKHYDLALVDPPYGINAPNMSMGSNPNRSGRDKSGEKQYGGESVAKRLKKGRLNSGAGKLKNRMLNNSDCSWDTEPPTEEYFQQLMRVSKNQIIWGGNYFNLPPTRGIVCWDKMQPWDNFSQFELAWTSFDKPAAMFRYSNTGGRNDEKKIHPTQKPVALYKWLLSKYANQGDKILDTHGGSMSIAIAAHDMGFELDLCEINEQYFKSGKLRLTQHQKQLRLL